MGINNKILYGIISVAFVGGLFSAVYAGPMMPMITLAGNTHTTGDSQVDGTLNVDSTISSPTITDLDSRLSSLENQFLNPSPSCSGSAACIPGIVTANVDGDTLKVYGKSIRFALVNAPESDEVGFQEAKDFIANSCPPNSFAVVDEDDLQTDGSFGRIIGVVFCNDLNLNEAILDAGLAQLASSFCSQSEFGTHAWAIEHGC